MTNATGWNDGYEADIAYDTSYYRELSPGWLVTTAMLAGVRPPRIDRAFRWAELGCGTGLTGAACAAATPHGEFWGFDFNPVHITKAINLADRAAIPNAIYQERSFAELASLPDAALPSFNFVVVHGVYSWLARENQAHLQDFIRRRLRPGGLACIGYNVATGWAPITPVGYLLRLLTEGHPAARGDVGAAIGLLEKLRDGGAEYLKRNPAAAAAVGSLSRSSRAYVTHHYMAENWRPQMFPQVADDMVRARCAYIASANLTDNFPVTSVPGALIPMLDRKSVV